LALALKGIPYEYSPVDLLPVRHEPAYFQIILEFSQLFLMVPFLQLVGNTTARLSEDFYALNPLGQVPLLEVTEADGSITRLTQSLAIIEYLEEAYPGQTPILPKMPLQRARARQV
jgi:glutathione S-transferase